MATKEGLTWKNPIRMQVTKTNQVAIAESIFTHQVPGLFVSDFGGLAGGEITYVCTSYKTYNNEPVWVKIDTTSGKPVVLASYFILVKYINKDESNTRNVYGSTVIYKNESLSKRQRYHTLGNIKKFGSYVFIGLSTKDIFQFGEGADALRQIVENTYFDSELLLEMSVVPKKLKQLYDYLSKDSNGLTGPGFREFEGSGMWTASAGRFRQFEGFNPGTTAASSVTSNNGSKNPSASPSGKSSSKSPSDNSTPASKPVTVKILDARIMNNGSTASSYNLNERRPYMEQKYFVYGTDTKQEITRRHVFDVIPNSFEFSQLGSQWNEVERSGNYPLVDWAKYNLTKVSFRFLVHGRRTDTVTSSTGEISTVVNDGLDISIDDQLDNLRAIGGAAHPLRIYNMNTFLTDSYRYPYLTKAGSIQWVIGDMSVTATRLTPQGNRVATAEVSITLMEYPVIGRDIVRLPPLAPSKPVIPGKDKPRTPAQYGLFSETLTWQPDEPLGYTSSKAETDE